MNARQMLYIPSWTWQSLEISRNRKERKERGKRKGGVFWGTCVNLVLPYLRPLKIANTFYGFFFSSAEMQFEKTEPLFMKNQTSGQHSVPL